MPHVVVAPDKFKGCLTAAQVAAAVADGLRAAAPDVSATLLPVADGGDGTVAAAVAAGFTAVPVQVEGPTGAAVSTTYARRGRRAVVELAAACGLDLLPGRTLAPLRASTFGLGQVIADAVHRGAVDIVVGLGGSASTDGGVGMVQALGAQVLDADGLPVGRGGGQLQRAATLELRGLRSALTGVRFAVACDVDSPLLGPQGAAAVFGPQKGATAADVRVLEAGLEQWAQLVAGHTGRDESGRAGAGAAGGAGFAAVAILDAVLVPGIELVLDLLDFPTWLQGADLVVTGEGCLDEQSLAGKAPVGVARAAAAAGVPTVAVAGRNLLNPERLQRAGISAAYALSDLEPDPARSMTNAAALLARTGERIARDWCHV